MQGMFGRICGREAGKVREGREKEEDVVARKVRLGNGMEARSVSYPTSIGLQIDDRLVTHSSILVWSE